MTGIFEAAWVIARRDFVATVWSRSFIVFLIVPLALFAGSILVSSLIKDSNRTAAQPIVALVTDSQTATALSHARDRLVAGTHELVFPILRAVPPAENVTAQARNLLADDAVAYSAVLGGTLDRPVLTGPVKIDETVGLRVRLLLDEARRTVALEARGDMPAPAALERVVTEQAAGNLQMIRRDIARGVMGLIFGITVLLATLMLSNLTEEKSNKVIEILVAAVPLDSIFLGKLIAMLGISFVGLTLWGGTLGLGYLFLQVVQDWMTLPQVAPAVGWPAFVVLVILYFATSYLLLGALFLGIGSQASNIRDIQTLTMPLTVLQVAVFFLAMSVIGREAGALSWFAWLFPFSSPLAMIGYAAEHASLWPHLLALVWQALWVGLIARASARLFRRTVLKSAPGGTFFNLGLLRRPGPR